MQNLSAKLFQWNHPYSLLQIVCALGLDKIKLSESSFPLSLSLSLTHTHTHTHALSLQALLFTQLSDESHSCKKFPTPPQDLTVITGWHINLLLKKILQYLFCSKSSKRNNIHICINGYVLSIVSSVTNLT